jgi:hypothetical protein
VKASASSALLSPPTVFSKSYASEEGQVRVQSLNDVPSQARTLVVPDVPVSVRGDFGPF